MDTSEKLYPLKETFFLGYPTVTKMIDDSGAEWGYPDFDKMDGLQYVCALNDLFPTNILADICEINRLRCLGISTDKYKI